ncbi:MAG: hypothetical protein BWK78_06215 [Thiotrichaceae bacterium IS1]|nr:MAG: hypothetical protein BWK78_06215 [Thiotrichaceae bacterium IS1]
MPPAPELPLEPNPVQDHPFKRFQSTLDSELWSRLTTQASQLGITTTALLLTAFAEILTRWSKRPQFTINLTLFNRLPLAEQVSQIVGDFTTLTMLAVDNSKLTETLANRAKRIQQQLWQDLDHRYFSGVQVLRELAKRRGGIGQTLMPVVFTSGLGVLEKGGSWLGHTVYGLSQTPQVWLDSQVEERESRLWLIWDVKETLFPAALIDAMFESYVTLLKQLAVAENWWQATTLDLLPSAQSEQRLRVNNTQAPIAEDLLHTLFIKQALATPDQVAVLAPGRTLTYDELYQAARQVGQWLHLHGAKPNTLVAVVMIKGWEQVVAVLGVLMAGAAYLPIDPELPTERQHYLLKQGEVTLALTQSHLDSQLVWPEQIKRLPVDTVDSGLAVLRGLPVLNSPLDFITTDLIQSPANLAYVIYTSGSTGLPKGVMIDHRGAVNTILEINRRFQVTATDRVLALSTLNFDLSVYDIFGLLAVGGAIVIPSPSGRRDPSHWAELMVKHGVTLWDTVPALMHLLVEYQNHRGLNAPLRLVMMSGDWIPLDLPDRIRLLWPDIQLFSLGGATEASIWSIYYPIAQVEPTWSSIPYGQPLTNQTFQVLNERYEPCPVWVPGQLYIGGIGLALGYWRDEAKTQESFITHPHTGERLYQTGDLGRYWPDGNIEFLGREDFQVKIRGHRIELGEIEAQLLKHSQIKEVVVSAVGESRYDQQLVAYIVPTTHSENQTDYHANDQAAYGLQKMHGVITDPMERIAFQLNQPGLRHFEPPLPSVALPQAEIADTAYLERQSYREFLVEPTTLTQLGQLLSCLSPRSFPGAVLPKYRYGSAGSLYPIQTYLYVKPNGITDLAAGVYYYHPLEHRLILLATEARLDRHHYDGTNQTIFDQSAFGLFLVAESKAIEPMYGQTARDFCLLEAGYMSQLLMMEVPNYDLGLCPIGGMEFAPLHAELGLSDSQEMVHSFLGGRISAAQKQKLVQATAPSQTLEEELKRYLAQKVPSYMVPNHYLKLTEMPLTANGKIDRQALPRSDSLNRPLVARVAPQTDLEIRLAKLVQRVLGLDSVSVTDNFFDLGASSLELVQLYNEVKAEFQRKLAIADLFRLPTVQALAEFLSQRPESPETVSPVITLEPTTEIDPERAGYLQSNLDNLSDDELDSLLTLL